MLNRHKMYSLTLVDKCKELITMLSIKNDKTIVSFVHASQQKHRHTKLFSVKKEDTLKKVF